MYATMGLEGPLADGDNSEGYVVRGKVSYGCGGGAGGGGWGRGFSSWSPFFTDTYSNVLLHPLDLYNLEYVVSGVLLEVNLGGNATLHA